jgi:3-oxoacyl-[acyl-carrier protein] reductase
MPSAARDDRLRRVNQPRIAIVTGAARGLGAATAQRLAADGMAVAVLDLDESAARPVAAAVVADGGRAIALGADVGDAAAVEAAVDRVVSELGPPTVLINNAGITRDNVLRKMSVDDWDAVAAVHLRGNFLFSRAVQPFMRDAGWGRIVNLSSVSALGNFGQVNYAAAKAGVQGITKTLAIELGPYGVTVNAVAPGFIESEMTAATAARMGVSFEEFKKTFAADIPVRRVGQPRDIAAAIAFFTSEEASFVSGQVLYVAGGPKA